MQLRAFPPMRELTRRESGPDRVQLNPAHFRTTVLIPTYNRAHFISECLESVLRQSLPVDHILVVDDGSTDGTKAACDRYAIFVDYVRFENGGKSAAINAALPLVKTSHVWVMDDDDILLDDAHTRLREALTRNPSAAFAFGAHDRFEDNAKTGTRSVFDGGYWRKVSDAQFFISSLEDMYVHQPGMLINTQALREAGTFNEDLIRSQDYDMLLRLTRQADVVSVDGPIFLQRQHDGTRGSASIAIQAGDRDRKWIEHDQQIFSDLLPQMSLNEFLPKGFEGDNILKRRTALLQRAVILARHKFWDEAFTDLTFASGLMDTALTSYERDLLRRTTQSKYGCDELVQDRTLRASLCNLASISPVAAEMVDAIAAGYRWRVRSALQKGQLGRALGHGYAYTCLRLASTVSKPSKRGALNGTVTSSENTSKA